MVSKVHLSSARFTRRNGSKLKLTDEAVAIADVHYPPPNSDHIHSVVTANVQPASINTNESIYLTKRNLITQFCFYVRRNFVKLEFSCYL